MNVLCLKLRNRHAVWNPATSPPSYFEDGVSFMVPNHRPANQNGILKGFRSRMRMKNSSHKMSPPLPVTEDTPPDMLAGAMDLHVVLPNGQDMKMSVERSTPMMDLLVQVTTASKISPGEHVIQAVGDRGILPYKPSTPIGALDIWIIHIVSKKQIGNTYTKKPLPNPTNQSTPFEQTFRLQVNLPRNQLYVSRISYKTRLEDILRGVCKEKNLDQSKYCLIHPEKLDEELDLSKTFLDYKLQQVTLTLKSNRPVGLSSVDIMALKRYDNGNQHVNNKFYASHSYDGSVSSGSIEGRSLSPVRSDESSSSPTIPKTNTFLNRPFRKKRPAPKPPTVQNGLESKHVPELVTISHSRNSSDSSGYHESSVLSESPESNSNSLADSLPRRSKLPTENPSCSNQQHLKPHSSNGKIGSSLSRSLSNLAVIGNNKKSMSNMLSNGMRRKEFSASSTSLTSIPGKRKKAPAPPPPTSSKSLLSLKEEDTISEHAPTTVSSETLLKSQTLPVTSKIPTSSSEITNSDTSLQKNQTISKQECAATSCTVDSFSVEPTPPVDVVDSKIISTNVVSEISLTKKPNSKEKELTMDDEEIDRIFNDATKDYESSSLSMLPSPPDSLINSQLIKNVNSLEDLYNWEYKLPSPPKAFRDQTNSPTITAYSAITISNVTDVTYEQNVSADEKEKSDILENNLKNSLYHKECQYPIQSKNYSKVTLNAGSYPSENVSEHTNQFYDSVSSTTSHRKSVDAVSVMDQRFSGCEQLDRSVAEEPKKIFNQFTEKKDFKVNEQKLDACESANLSCDKSSFIDMNYMMTNDSGLGSDDSIPSISEGRSGSDDPVFPKKHIDTKFSERRGSTLQNFTITTYQNSNSKPTEIFHDDSVKTSRTTQLAKSNRPFASASNERKILSKSPSGLMRHSSFNNDKTPNALVKRSKSHISLLSGNFTKFNRLGKLHTELPPEETNSESSSEKVDICIENHHKLKTVPNATSNLRRTISEVSINKDSNKDGDELLELQDQVMKWKENQRKSHLTKNINTENITELQSLQVLKDILPQINRPLPQNTQNSTTDPIRTSSTEDISSSTNRFKMEIKPRLSVDHAPTVNLQSWSERPKRQVSIKTDRDYVFGNSRKNNNEQYNSLHNSKKDADHEERVSHSTDTSRIPIVRAVEFKKPFAQKVENLKKSCFPFDGPKPEVQQAEKEMNHVDPKPKPSSFYLFGEHLQSSTNQSEENFRKPSPPVETVVQRFVETRANSSENNGSSCVSVNSCNMSNTSAIPFRRKTVTHLNGNMQRFSYSSGVSMNKDPCNRIEGYTFKTYKNKLVENEKLSNGFHSEVNEESYSSRPNAGGSYGQKSTSKSCSQNNGCLKTIPTNKSFDLLPPPVPPSSISSLKPVSYRVRSKSFHNENPRDMLLSSIKNFNRDNLRKLHIK